MPSTRQPPGWTVRPTSSRSPADSRMTTTCQLQFYEPNSRKLPLSACRILSFESMVYWASPWSIWGPQPIVWPWARHDLPGFYTDPLQMSRFCALRTSAAGVQNSRLRLVVTPFRNTIWWRSSSIPRNADSTKSAENQLRLRGGRPPSRRPRLSARRACSSEGVRIARLPIASSQVGIS